MVALLLSSCYFMHLATSSLQLSALHACRHACMHACMINYESSEGKVSERRRRRSRRRRRRRRTLWSLLLRYFSSRALSRFRLNKKVVPVLLIWTHFRGKRASERLPVRPSEEPASYSKRLVQLSKKEKRCSLHWGENITRNNYNRGFATFCPSVLPVSRKGNNTQLNLI